MAMGIISRIISALEKGGEGAGKCILHNGLKHEIKKENFRPITDLSRAKAVFIDGGNAELISAPNFSLQFVRVVAVAYENNKRARTERKEFYVLASAKNIGDKIVYGIQAFGESPSFSDIDSEESSMMQGRHRASASSAVELCRRLAEIRMAVKMAEGSAGGIIVLDGSLEAEKPGEKQEFDMLFRKAGENDVTLCGLSKTTRMITESGGSAAAAVSAISQKGEWFYDVGEGIYLAKLHRNSGHIFRIDAKGGVARAASALKQNSSDPVFLGYPYGLIEADRLARVSNNEAEYQRMMFAAKAGKSLDRVKAGINSLNAHSILDSIS